MTKHRRTFTLSKELDEALPLVASGLSMNISEFLETRLRSIPEIKIAIERINELPEDPEPIAQPLEMPQ